MKTDFAENTYGVLLSDEVIINTNRTVGFVKMHFDYCKCCKNVMKKIVLVCVVYGVYKSVL